MNAARLRRMLLRAMAIATPLSGVAALGCQSDDGSCGPVDVFAPDASASGVPACDTGSIYSLTKPNPSCSDVCGDPNGQFVCCYSAWQPATFECQRFRQPCAGGRAPEGWSPAVRVAESAAEFLADCAQLEAASVAAFRTLASDLRRLGAPRKLVRRASRAKRDEARHFRVMRALARRHGGVASWPAVAPPAVARSLEAIAIENAVEGCVRETFGALLAEWQARHATDGDARRAMRRIAREETQHAALAWDVHAWALVRLDGRARANVERAAWRAARELVDAAARSAPRPYDAILGRPSPRRTEALAVCTMAMLGA